jgi:hypothetical protein
MAKTFYKVPDERIQPVRDQETIDLGDKGGRLRRQLVVFLLQPIQTPGHPLFPLPAGAAPGAYEITMTAMKPIQSRFVFISLIYLLDG